MLCWLVFGAVVFWPSSSGYHAFLGLGNQFLAWLLFALLGWETYGPAIK